MVSIHFSLSLSICPSLTPLTLCVCMCVLLFLSVLCSYLCVHHSLFPASRLFSLCEYNNFSLTLCVLVSFCEYLGKSISAHFWFYSCESDSVFSFVCFHLSLSLSLSLSLLLYHSHCLYILVFFCASRSLSLSPFVLQSLSLHVSWFHSESFLFISLSLSLSLYLSLLSLSVHHGFFLSVSWSLNSFAGRQNKLWYCFSLPVCVCVCRYLSSIISQ